MRIAIACGLVFGAVALLPQQAAAQFAEKKVLTLEILLKIVATAETEAARNHLAGVVAVVDDGGWPILIERMDHAAYTASVELAPGKARTAALFKKPSQALEVQRVIDDEQLLDKVKDLGRHCAGLHRDARW